MSTSAQRVLKHRRIDWGENRSDTDRVRDRGDTLVELLVTIVIIGLAVTALLGALLTTTSAAGNHRASANFDSYLVSFAETARSQLEFQSYNGTSSGPSFKACQANYQLVGTPIPKSGPAGSSVAILGTGFTPTGGSNGTFAGATFQGDTAPFSVTAINSSPAGDIGQFTVPTEPAGTYTVAPFDGTHRAASSFTITPWVGPMTPAGGGQVKVSVSGFGAGATLTVSFPSWQLGTVISGNPISANGSGTLVFTPPVGVSGEQEVTISDDSANTAQPELLAIPTDTGTGNPPFTVPAFSTYMTFNMGVSFWNSASGGWTLNQADCTGAGYDPNIQQLKMGIADNQPGSGADSAQTLVVSNLAPQGTPAPPSTLTALAPGGPGAVKLGWYSPTFQGAAAVTSFNIYRSAASGSQGTKIASVPTCSPTPCQTTYSDTGLAVGSSYYYEVTAVNSIGESATSSQVTGTTLPGAPQGLQATGGDSQVSLSWSAPSPNGNATISSYNIYQNTVDTQPPTPLASVSSGTSYTATGLSNGTTYWYWVTAVNAGGEGPAATASATAGTTPTAPQNLTASSTNTAGELKLSWSAPASDGGLAVVSYNIYRSTSNSEPPSPVASVPAGTLTYSDTGLMNGRTYFYWVSASNAAGTGPSAGSVSAVPGLPGAPTGLSGSAGSTTSRGTKTYFVTLSWTAPAVTGGSTLTYNVYRSTSPGTQGSEIASGVISTTYRDTAVIHGTPYYYVVTAMNSVGEGPPSGQTGAVTP